MALHWGILGNKTSQNFSLYDWIISYIIIRKLLDKQTQNYGSSLGKVDVSWCQVPMACSVHFLVGMVFSRAPQADDRGLDTDVDRGIQKQ